MFALTKVARAALLFAVVPLAWAEDPNPKELLEKADAATLKVKSISYKAEAKGGRGAGSATATLKIQQHKEKAEDLFPMFLIEGTLQGGENKLPFTIANDGSEMMSIDTTTKTVRRVKAGGPQDSDPLISGPMQFVWMREYNHPKPFSDEINADEQKYEGRKTVGGVECNVVLVKYKGLPQRARWYFGVQDNLPRKVERMMEGGTSSLELSDVVVDPKLDASIFSPKTPAGMEEDSPGQFGAGRSMPEFELKTPDGKAVSLASLKGKTVVLQFWTGWDGPAKKALPALQRIAETEKGNDAVAVYGVYVWEKKDASAFLKENNYTFATLVDGDKLAETLRVEKLPAFFVINTEGKISFSAAGWDEQRESELKAAIKAAKAK